MNDLVQIFRVSICPVAQKTQDRLAVIAQAPFHFLAGTILIKIFFITDLFKKALDVLCQDFLQLVPVIGFHSLSHIRHGVNGHHKQIAQTGFAIVHILKFLHCVPGILLQNPVDKSRNVLKVIIKSLTGNLAFLYDFFYR